MPESGPADRTVKVSDDYAASLELPANSPVVVRPLSAYERFMHEVRHPENHRQLVCFLVVGASGYIVNLAVFALCIHLIKASDTVSLIVGFLAGCANNFVWNRHWTFKAKEEHAFTQGLRFLLVSTLVFLFATGLYDLETHVIGIDKKVVADGVSWAVATPLSFLVQKLWSFKA